MRGVQRVKERHPSYHPQMHAVTLMELVGVLLKRSALTSSILGKDDPTSNTNTMDKTNQRLIDLAYRRSTIRDVCSFIEDITRNGYPFVNYCQQLVGYSSPHEMTEMSSNELCQCVSFISVSTTFSSVFHAQNVLNTQ
jgi:hypothetical protein